MLYLAGAQIVPDCVTGIATFGQPHIVTYNCGIYAQTTALASYYWSTTNSFFRLENSTFSAGIGSAHSDTPVIIVQSFSGSSAQPFLGSINHIKDCTIKMNSVGRGIQMQGIRNFKIEENDVDIHQAVSSGSIFNAGIRLVQLPKVRVTGNHVSFTGNNQFNNFTGIDMESSLDCFVKGNSLHNTKTGVKVSGNCGHPLTPNDNSFVENVFSGVQETGLLVTPNGVIGMQRCHDNRWEGAFSSLGYDCQGVILSNLFTVNPGSLPVYQPINNGAIQFDGNCPALLEISGGGGSLYLVNNGGELADIEVFPNPTNGRFTVTVPQWDNTSDQACSVELTDLTGRSLFSGQMESGLTSKAFEVDGLGSGVYLLRVLSGAQSRTVKLIVDK